MTQETHGTTAAPHFSDTEWQTLQSEDIGSAKIIVCLLTGIFILGLSLYLFVAWWVS